MSLVGEEISEDELPVVTNVDRNPNDTQQTERLRNCRSTTARTRRNQQRNLIHCQHRDQDVIVPEVYRGSDFTQIKTILRERNEQYVHSFLHKDRGYVAIGMNTTGIDR